MVEVIAELSNQVAQVGFPIVCVFLLYQQMKEQTTMHKAEMDKITETIHNNTLALNKLTDYINLKLGGNEK